MRHRARIRRLRVFALCLALALSSLGISILQVFVYEAGLGNLRHLLDDGTGWKWENFDGQGGSPAGRLNANVGLDPVVTTFGGGLQLFYYDYEHGDLRHAVPQ